MAARSEDNGRVARAARPAPGMSRSAAGLGRIRQRRAQHLHRPVRLVGRTRRDPRVLPCRRAVSGAHSGMPIICTFFGIVIRMYYQEHAPPHFHAEYQGQRATFDFGGERLIGEFRSGTAMRLIQEWAAQHRVQLEANWANMEAGRALERIQPLE